VRVNVNTNLSLLAVPIEKRARRGELERNACGQAIKIAWRVSVRGSISTNLSLLAAPVEKRARRGERAGRALYDALSVNAFKYERKTANAPFPQESTRFLSKHAHV
jgi:hypothetical protein